MKKLLLLIIPFLITACENSEKSVPDLGNETAAYFRVNVVGAEVPYGTKSILSEDIIETKITCLTLAAYSENGTLIEAKHYESDFMKISMLLPPDESCNVYALANMGDMTGEFPVSENDVEYMEYILSTYEDVDKRGLPMCGETEASAGRQVQIDLYRLFAKVCVRIKHTDLLGASPDLPTALNLCNKSIYVRQANKRLLPFSESGSMAGDESDIMDISDYNPNMNNMDIYDGPWPEEDLTYGPAFLQDVSLVLYVPENVQGVLLPDNDEPFGKVYENIENVAGKSYSNLCTYVEFNASRVGNEGYSGNLMFRYYLGADNTSDFNVRRNSRYDLTLDFSEDGFFVDSWKVTRSDWRDNRVLRFEEEPYRIYPGSSENIMIHFHRYAPNPVHSDPYPERWEYIIDEEAMNAAGLSITFDPDNLVQGENGYNDFCIKMTSSSDAKVGMSVPITIRTTDGSISDHTIVTVVENSSFETGWDFIPEYVAQYGTFTVSGYDEFDLPFKCTVSDDSRLLCTSEDENTFRVVALAAGNASVIVSNADGTKTASLPLRISAPVLTLGKTSLELNPDGETGEVSYSYKTDSGTELSNIDSDAFDIALKPIVRASNYFSASVSENALGVYVGNLYADEVMINLGETYSVTVAASGCDDVEEKRLSVKVIDPFSGVRSVDYGKIDDYTLLGLSSVNSKIRNKFAGLISANASFVIDGPLVNADPEYVAASLVPRWTNSFSNPNGIYDLSRNVNTGNITITQKTVGQSTSHSAGIHDIMLSVKNRHSSEITSKSCGTLGIYVHAVIGARAEFGNNRCDMPGSGVTFAEVYNSVSGGRVYYNPSSTKYIHYMDVSAE